MQRSLMRVTVFDHSLIRRASPECSVCRMSGGSVEMVTNCASLEPSPKYERFSACGTFVSVISSAPGDGVEQVTHQLDDQMRFR
ncbi:MAG: hypothetical protein U0703_26080 [Anaerolineae bacterium]